MKKMQFEEPERFWKRWLRADIEQRIAMMEGITKAIETQIANATVLECSKEMRRRMLGRLLNGYFEELAAAVKKAR